MYDKLVFVVDDDPWYSDFLEHQLKLSDDYHVEKWSTGKQCLHNLHKKPIAITLDYSLPDMKGYEVLQKIQESHPEIPVIVVSGQEDINTVVELLKLGAYDYIIKDEDTHTRLWNTMRNVNERKKLNQKIEILEKEVDKKYSYTNLIKGNSNSIKRIFRLIDKASDSNITVSINGETGTGKELVARAIHFNSNRKHKPFVPINVGAIPSELIESEFFGHEKGAFTGAVAKRKGKFEEADQGTLFLDEIAEMDLNMQTKLLRVLQEKEIIPVGGNKAVSVNCRIICATHKDLASEVKAGRFRADLFYRLAGLPIDVPPLRDRGSDILLLAKEFAKQFCLENERESVVFSNEAQKKLMTYNYPGNVRELKSVVDLAIILSDTNVVDVDHISFNPIDDMNNLLEKTMTLAEYNREIITHYLKKYDRKVLKVAKMLGIGKSTLYRLMKEYGIS